MKPWWAIGTVALITGASAAWGAGAPASAPKPAAANLNQQVAYSTVTGEVLENKDVEIYTYLRLKTKDGEVWAAVGKAPVKKGDKVTVVNATMMTDFESKTLKKKFASIYFGNLAGTGAAAAGAGQGMPANHEAMVKAAEASAAAAPINVPKATGANARTVAEIVTKSGELKDKAVRVRGKVVKFNPDIMGKNWIHLRDGSGNAGDGSNDVLVTTAAQAKVGDVVTLAGTVRTDKDFGSGYSYKVLVEDAKLEP